MSCWNHTSNRLVQILFGAFLLIAFRVGHLATFQHEAKLIEAQKPQVRTIIQPAQRGEICDRFGLPLATNRISYNATVYYNQFKPIPMTQTDIDASGIKTRSFPRKEYIHRFSLMLGKELSQDAGRIEDLIYAKASLLPHVPFIVASHIAEEQYYRLKSLERLWPGLHAEIASERIYPQGKTASSVIGYLGAISQNEFFSIAHEISQLQQSIACNPINDPDHPDIRRMQELISQAYTINDRVGKTGIEKHYEHQLRGLCGKTVMTIDREGSYHENEIESSKPVTGQTLSLTLSAELTQFCEQLLIASEEARDHRLEHSPLKQPFIRGGAIIALDPNNGEILALAGIPRLDPNDLTYVPHRKQKANPIHRWLENSQYIARLFDGTDQLFRERSKGEEQRFLSLETYLEWTLPPASPLLALWNRVNTIRAAIQLQEDFELLLYHTGNPHPLLLMDALFPPAHASPDTQAVLHALQSHSPDVLPARHRLEKTLAEIPQNSDKLFAIDISRILVYSPAFTNALIEQVGSISLSTYRSHTQALQRALEEIRAQCRVLFHHNEFACWREAHQKKFLQERRKEEAAKKIYAHPYTDYLDAKEKELFDAFWQEMQFPLVAALLRSNPTFIRSQWHPYFDALQTVDLTPLRAASVAITDKELVQWLKTMRPYRALQRPLLGSYRFLRGTPGKQIEQDLAAAFYPIEGFGFSRNHAYQCAAPMGSLFKLVTACEALRQKGPSERILTIIDMIQPGPNESVATTLDHKPYYRKYKGGRLPRSHLPHLGAVDLIGALEQSSNPYFALLAGDILSHPNDLTRAATEFGFGQKSGIDLPGEIAGRLPTDLEKNRTGLYSFAIGQHTLVTTPLQVAVLLEMIANGGTKYVPHLLQKQPVHIAPSNEHLTESIRSLLCEGLDRAVWGPKGSARPAIIKGLHNHSDDLREFLSLQHQMIGKTSTAEISCRLDVAPSSSSQIYKHIWFGAIAFPKENAIKSQRERWKNPELVVVVYLRCGDGGKEAAPLAARVITKWREIKKRHSEEPLAKL